MSKKVIVIGGGISGLCCAYFLKQEGHDVTVLDKSKIDSGASFVNAGYITPSHIVPLASPGMISKGLRYMFNSASPFYMKPQFNIDFLKWAWSFKKSSTSAKVNKALPVLKEINMLSRGLYEQIFNSGDLGTFHLERKGLLMLYKSQKLGDSEMAVAEKAKDLGLAVTHLSMSELDRIEPNIQINASGAVYYECDWHMTPSVFMVKMLAYLKASGVQILSEEEVIDIDSDGFTITGLSTSKGKYSADEFVFAAGAWSGALAKKFGFSLLLQPGKGYRINVSQPTGISVPAILMDAKMAVTPMQGFTRFAGTMEFSGINSNILPERVAAIAKGAELFYEGLEISQQDKEMAQCGLRPVSPDGLPYIGKAGKYNNLTLATGHAMMGWSLGPITGKLVTAIVSGKKPMMPIEPFNPNRKF